MTRRAARRLAIGCPSWVLAGLVAGCAVNPATGGLDFMLVSQEEEREIGRETHREVLAEFGGAYYDPGLATYVERVGARIAKTAEIQEFEYRFTVLDSPNVNAFALPGGFVYVTRGLLALVGNEAELAGALSHELAHINARHAAQRLSRLKTRERICAVLICDSDVPVLQDLATIGAMLAFEGFTQEQEFEADRIGIRYLHAAGYDVSAMLSFLNKLRAQTELEARLAGTEDLPSEERQYSRTHPLTGERVARAGTISKDYPATRGRVGEADYLAAIDGMLYGNRREYGFVMGRVYAHPIRRITFTVPHGFALQAESRRVTAIGPEDSILLVEPSRLLFDGTMEDYLTGTWGKGIELRDVRALEVNGMAGATGWMRRDSPAGLFDFRLLAVHVEPGVIYRFLFATRAHMTERLSEDMRRTTYSFRRLSGDEADALQPQRIRVVTASDGDSVESLAAQTTFGDDAAARLSVLNGLEGSEVPAGRLVKLVRP